MHEHRFDRPSVLLHKEFAQAAEDAAGIFVRNDAQDNSNSSENALQDGSQRRGKARGPRFQRAANAQQGVREGSVRGASAEGGAQAARAGEAAEGVIL